MPLLSGPGDPPDQVLSTDVIRAELFGDAAVQGPWVAASDPASAEELEAIFSPLPEGDPADRAAAFRGGCMAPATPIQLAPAPLGPMLGGLPPMGDGPVFLRVMTLLRHLLQVPFDRPAERGANLPGEPATLRKDLEKILTPYGFRQRNDNVRHGYCLGTAVLSPPRLRELHHVVRQTAGRLADPSAQDLLAELDERLGWAGISADGLPPARSYARHAVVDTALVRRDSLAAPRRAETIETAIVEHRRVLLQLIFHNVGWYQLFGKPRGNRQPLLQVARACWP